MQHKFLLRFIRDEMLRQKIDFKGNEGFFNCFFPEEEWQSYRSNVSNWLSSKEDGTIRKASFIEAINEKLGLPREIWGASEGRQKEAVYVGIERLKERENDSMFFPWVEKVGINERQESFLSEAKEATLEIITDHMKRETEFFNKTAQNQDFLIALFHLMYRRGEYMFVYKYIFPALLDTYDNDIKSKKADIYASLPTPMYREAFEILQAIKGESKNETLDLQTMAISNIRRERLSMASLEKEELKELLVTLMACYSKVYDPKQTASYYAAINLAYVLSLVEHIFPSEITHSYSIKTLYESVKPAISKAKSSDNEDEQYYGSMSEIEFNLLLNRKGMRQELEQMLESIEPVQTHIDHTKRQMEAFFIHIIEKFGDEKSKDLQTFKDFLEVFDDYTSAKKIV